MGTAIWQQDTCVRTAGESCTTCIDVCPIGEMAIVLDGNQIKVIEDGCTGCGMCQNRCPTRPRSITVKPRSVAPTASQPRGRK
jgi:ferredoxin-type protein NapG